MVPLQISFPDFPPSDAVRQAIEEKMEKVEKMYPRIQSAEVIVRNPHHHHHQGRVYHVEIKLKVPNKEIVVSKEPEKNEAHTDVYVAIRDAFNALKRQLEKHFEKMRQH